MNKEEKMFRKHVSSVVTPGGGFALDAQLIKVKNMRKKIEY